MSSEAFDRIHQAIDDFCTEERETLLQDILSDLSSEIKDPHSLEVIDRVIGYYLEKRAATPFSPVGRMQRTGGTEKTGGTERTERTERVAQSVSENCEDSRNDSVKTGGCSAIMKSGVRKGQECGSKAHSNGMCKRHMPKVISDVKCPAIMKAGARKGQACGTSVGNGDTYCGKHKVVKCVFKIGEKHICGRGISVHSPSETHCRIHLKNELGLDTKTFITVRNRNGYMEHKYSGLIFSDKKVVGIQHQSGDIDANLTDDDFECVIVYGLPLSSEYNEKFSNYISRRKSSILSNSVPVSPHSSNHPSPSSRSSPSSNHPSPCSSPSSNHPSNRSSPS